MNPIYELKYDLYKFVLDTKTKKIEVYFKGRTEPQATLEDLPIGIKWENLELILNHDDKKLKEDLAKKIIDLYEKL